MTQLRLVIKREHFKLQESIRSEVNQKYQKYGNNMSSIKDFGSHMEFHMEFESLNEFCSFNRFLSNMYEKYSSEEINN